MFFSDQTTKTKRKHIGFSFFFLLKAAPLKLEAKPRSISSFSSLMAQCPANSFSFNTTLCACNPGYILNSVSKYCTSPPDDVWAINSGIDYSLKFPATIVSLDSINKFTQSKPVFLEATFVMLVSWLLFCFLVRFGKVNQGKSIWFKFRWWISRLDVCYATRHWLDDQKVVMKRKTELGGTFSIASWILFIGLFALLLYQIISKRTVEVHNVRATNGPDLLTFVNDLEFNITTISSMSCSQLRSLGTVVTGTPSFIDYRVSPLSVFANYSCYNTSRGPTISLRCSNCHIARDDMYISWQFVDLPNNPATAVGFHFNFTAKNVRANKHVSFVSGTVKNGSSMDNRPVTFRGSDVNILKFHLFPRVYHNLHDLRLIQPLFHEFVPGSSFLEASQLQDSLQNSKDGLVNTTLFLNFLSAYIVEIDDENVFGPVGFLADLGGLYAISFAIFFYFLAQCEYRVKKLRYEDRVLRNMRSRKRAQQHWDKLRKYVMYTWGCSSLEGDSKISGDQICCFGGVDVSGSLHKRRQPSSRMDTISFSQHMKPQLEMNIVPKSSNTRRVESCSARTGTKLETTLPHPMGEHVLEHKRPDIKLDGGRKDSGDFCKEDSCQLQVCHANDCTLPLPPVLEYKNDSGNDVSEIRKNLQNLYDYNVMLREKFILAQSMLETLTKKATDPQR